MPIRIQFIPSRVLAVLSVIFYGMLFAIPWILPWGKWNFLVGSLVIICAYPFFKQIKRRFRPEIMWIELQDGKISTIKKRDGTVHQVQSFKVSRLLIFYIEVCIVLADQRIRLCIFQDMVDAETMSTLRRFFNTLPQK